MLTIKYSCKGSLSALLGGWELPIECIPAIPVRLGLTTLTSRRWLSFPTTLSKCSKGGSFVLAYKKMKRLYQERARLVLGQALVPVSFAGLNLRYLLQERLGFLVWDLCDFG